MINFYYLSNKLLFLSLLQLAFPTGLSFGTVYIVSDSGGDFTIIQNALNVAVAGDTILVREKVTPYIEELRFPISGDSVNGYITLMAYEGEHPIIDGTGLNGGSDWPQALIKIINKNYIRIIGFEIRNLITSNGSKFPAGIWVRGSSHHIQIINNNVHNIEQNANNAGAHGIAVYGTNGSSSINNILIEGNEVHDNKLGWSESLVLNGNVENFIVRNNVVHDNDNIAYDFIGFEGVSPNPELDQARNGLVVDNVAYNIDSRGNPAYGGEASADGFYVDGGKDIIIERNTVYNSNIGIEIASEHGGKTTSGIIVRNNLIRDNIVLGLAIGGYDQNRGSANNCVIVNNTFYKNNYENFDWGAEILIQYYSNNNIFKNNIIYSLSDNPLIDHSTGTGSENIFNNNIYYTDGNAIWYWGSNTYLQFDDFKTGAGQDNNSLFDNPELLDPSNNDPALSGTSPAIDNGQNLIDSLVGETDYFGKTRIVNGQVDIGTAEYTIVNSFDDKSDVLPNEFYLYPAYPNPFNPETTFSFNLPANLTDTPIELIIYNTNGEEIDKIDFTNLTSGSNYYKWDYTSRKGISLSSGVYFAVLKSDKLMKTTKIVLLK